MIFAMLTKIHCTFLTSNTPSAMPSPLVCVRPNENISVFRVTGLKILGRVGIFLNYFFLEKKFFLCNLKDISMESQPQNPEFRYNPENFHPCNSFRSSISATIMSHRI